MNKKEKKGFLVVAHGSRKEEANKLVFTLVKRLRSYFQTDMFEPAFMEIASPSIEDGINVLIGKDINKLIVYPFFLFKGMHFSRDVPNIVKKKLDQSKKKITCKIMDPIGMHPDIFDIVKDMLCSEVNNQPAFKQIAPEKIEDESMEIIEQHIESHKIPVDQKPIVKRVIHTTGDFDFLESMIFKNEAVSQGLKAISAKKTIYTDVTMVQAGINKKFGHIVKCIINEPGVVSLAKVNGSTRAAAGIESLCHKLDGNIVAIGNAPTALIALIDMLKSDNIKPALVVGIPVGFVNARESKEYLATLKDIPYITNRGYKGGSAVAAAIVNALMKIEFMDKQASLEKTAL